MFPSVNLQRLGSSGDSVGIRVWGNAIFRESIVLVSSAKTVTALPAVSPRHNAMESADTMCFFIVKYLHAFVWSYNVLLRIWNMTQAKSLRIKRAVTLFLLEVGYNRKLPNLQTNNMFEKRFFHYSYSRNKKYMPPSMYRKWLSSRCWQSTCKKGEQVSVDPDGILSTRTYGLPRNLVFVITNSDRSTRALPLALHSVNRINCIIPVLELQ